MNYSRCIILGVIGLLLCGFPVVAVTGGRVMDKERGFSFTVPVGFEVYEEGLGAGKDVIYSYINRDPENGVGDMVLFVSRQQGAILQGVSPDLKQVRRSAPGYEVRLEKIDWRSHEIDVLLLHKEYKGEVPLVSITAQVPLTPNAIHVATSGTLENEAVCLGVLKQITDSIVGPSNWDGGMGGRVRQLTTAERIGELVKSVIGFVVFGAVIVWVMRKIRGKPKAG